MEVKYQRWGKKKLNQVFLDGGMVSTQLKRHSLRKIKSSGGGNKVYARKSIFSRDVTEGYQVMTSFISSSYMNWDGGSSLI